MVGRVVIVAAGLSLGLSSGAAAQGAPAPGPEHKKLAYFVGKWKMEGELKGGPMGPGGKTTSVDNCTWFAGDFNVVCHGDGSNSAGPMKSIGILGYNPNLKKYTYYGIDNSGMGGDLATGTLAGDTWSWSSESMMNGQAMKSRYTIKELSPDAYTFTWEASLGGAPYILVLQGKESRIK